MTRTKVCVAGLLGAFAFVANAHAADPAGSWPPPPQVSYERPEPQFKELLSGWYVRADIGYRWNSFASFEAATPVVSQKYNNAIAGTLGVGYKYQWFRADVTVDRSVRTNFSGTTAGAGAQPRYTAKITPLSGLGNVYADLGTWAGFTPYVGAGVGFTQISSEEYFDATRPTGTGGKGKSVNFSWAWMAGIAVQVKPNWIVDIGFRHLDMGSVKTNNQLASVTIPDVATFDKLTAQEVRIGLRFLFD